MYAGYADASSNGCISNPALSNRTSILFFVKFSETIKSANLVKEILSPTPSTTHVSLSSAYFSGNTWPEKYNTIPLDNVTPLLDVYVVFPMISFSISILVFDSMSAIKNLPNLFTSVVL